MLAKAPDLGAKLMETAFDHKWKAITFVEPSPTRYGAIAALLDLNCIAVIINLDSNCGGIVIIMVQKK